MIQSIEEANLALLRLGRAERDLRGIEDDANAAIDVLKKRANAKSALRAALAADLRAELAEYVRAHKRALFPGAGRSIKLTFGRLALKLKPPRLKFARGFSEADVIAAIRRALPDPDLYIDVVEQVRKSQLRILDEEALARIGCAIEQPEDIVIEPIAAQIAPGEGKEVA